MKKRRNRSDSSAWMALPLYIFTIVFVVCPLIYMVALSFATPSRGFGVTWKFTLDNYRNILEPVYLNTFVESLKLAFTSTIVIALIGYPFGYFMARLPEHRKKKAQLLLSTPFWVNSLIRLYGWIIILQKKGLLNFVLIKLGIIEKPLSILYSYPAIVIGSDLCASPVYDHVCILQRREAGLVLCGGCQRSWCIQTAGIFYHNTEAYTARAAFGCDPDFRAIHGTVRYCRYPGRK